LFADARTPEVQIQTLASFRLNLTLKGTDMRSIAQPKEVEKPQSDHCSRCRRESPTRGRFTQTVRGVKRFICAACCAKIGSVAALIRHAEDSEREVQRRRFTERRTADRREAA